VWFFRVVNWRSKRIWWQSEIILTWVLGDEMGWPDTGDLARILKWLTVAFRENYPDRIRGFCDLWDCVWQFRFRQASCARMRLVEVDNDRARVNLSWWACEVCRIRRLGKKRQGLCLCIWKCETRLTLFDLLN
jgi:hypothetical protein